MAETLTPPQKQGWKIRGEGQPIPAPTYLADGAIGLTDHLELFGACARTVVINGCLADVRALEPDATSYRVAEWIDAYLTYYEGLLLASDPTPAAPDPQPRVCSNCGAVLGPKETGHFVPPSVGESGFYYCRGAAPDQAEGPREPKMREIL